MISSDDESVVVVGDSDSDVEYVGSSGPGFHDHPADMNNFVENDDYDNNNYSTWFDDSDSELFNNHLHTTEAFWFGHLVVPMSSSSAADDPAFGNLWSRFRNASFRYSDDANPSNLDLGAFGNVAGPLRNPNTWNLPPAEYKELLRSIVDQMELNL